MTTTTPQVNPDAAATARMVEQLVNYRRACKISRTEIARRMGTTRGVVKRLEVLATRPGAQMMTYQRYARAVGAPISFCLDLPEGPVQIGPPPLRTPTQRAG